MTELVQLLGLYLDAHPTQKADTTERVTQVETLGRAAHSVWALLPIQDLATPSTLPVLEIDSIHVPLQTRGQPNTWTLPDVFGAVFPSASNITVQSYTYVPTTPLSGGATKLAFRLHRLSGPGLPFASYLQAVKPLRAKLADIEASKARLASNQTPAAEKSQLMKTLKAMNAQVMERRYKIVIRFVDMMNQSGAYDASVEVDTSGPQPVKVVTVRDRVSAVLTRIQGCPSFEPVAYMHVPPVSTSSGWESNFIVVPRLSANLVPLRKLVEAKCALTLAQKLAFILDTTQQFKHLFHCILSRHVVWLTPRVDAMYANLTKSKKVEYLVAPATQLYNMFAVSALPLDTHLVSDVLEEFVSELIYMLAGPDRQPWNTLDVTRLKPYDVQQLLCPDEVVPDISSFQAALNTLMSS